MYNVKNYAWSCDAWPRYDSNRHLCNARGVWLYSSWELGEETMRILLADDHINLANTISLWLRQKADFELVGIVTASEEIEDAVRRATPSVLLLDWDLPGLTSDEQRRELMQRLRALFPLLYIVVLRSDLLAIPRALSGMINGYISKTESPDHLLDLLVSLNM